MQSPEFARQLPRTVARSVAVWRRRRGLTQAQLAEIMGLSNKMIAKVESGHHDLRLSTLARLADALQLDPAQLMNLEAQPDDPTTQPPRRTLTGLAALGWKKVKAQSPGAVAVLDLQPRAGRAHAQAEPLTIAWASPPSGCHLTEEGLFLAQVRGDSMTPTVADGAWCLFSRQVTQDDVLGHTVLVRETDAAGMTAWSVKRATALRVGDGQGRVLELTSANPAYPVRYVPLDGSGDAGVEAVVREVLRPARA